MSKIAERMPALADPKARLALTLEKIDGVVNNGRVVLSDLHDVLIEAQNDHPVNADLLEEEGRNAIAQQCIAQLVNQRMITIDRKSKTPVYQTDFGFAGNWFKVGGTLVAPDVMTLQDFDLMIERISNRIDNATIDRDVWIDFRDRARPGLEAGQSLVDQFDAGTLSLYAADAPPAIESSDENGQGG